MVCGITRGTAIVDAFVEWGRRLGAFIVAHAASAVQGETLADGLRAQGDASGMIGGITRSTAAVDALRGAFGVVLARAAGPIERIADGEVGAAAGVIGGIAHHTASVDAAVAGSGSIYALCVGDTGPTDMVGGIADGCVPLFEATGMGAGRVAAATDTAQAERMIDVAIVGATALNTVPVLTPRAALTGSGCNARCLLVAARAGPSNALLLRLVIADETVVGPVGIAAAFVAGQAAGLKVNGLTDAATTQ